MAKLPSEADLGRVLYRPSSPSVSVRAPDYSGIARAGQEVARGLSVVAKADDEVSDFETKKRMLDFELESESALLEQSKSIGPGGTGFSAGWRETYRKRARDFVGRDDASIPESQRAKVGLWLKEKEVELGRKAQNFEAAERNRYDVESLETTLGKTRGAVEADPGKRNQMLAEGNKLIELSPISPADKHRLRKKYGIEVDKAAAASRLMSAKTAKDYEALRDELAPDKGDQKTVGDVTGVLTSGTAKGKASGWAARNATWQGLSQFEKAAAMSLMEADGMNTEDARNVLGAMINRASKNGEDLGAHVSQKIYQPTIEPAQEARLERILLSPKFKELVRWGQSRASGVEGDPVNGATHFLAPESTMLALERQNPGKYKNWGPRGANWTGYDSTTGEYRGVILRDSSHAFLAPDGTAETAAGDPDPNAYQGPYGNLTLEERKTLWAQAETKRKAEVEKISKEITKLEAMSVQGYTLPEPMLLDLEKRVVEAGDKSLETQFGATLGTATVTAGLSRGRPEDVAAVAAEARSKLTAGATPAQLERVVAVEKLAKELEAGVRDDPMTWANRVKIEINGQPIQLEQLNPTDPEQLTRRFEQARAVSQYYNQPLQVFTKAEREAYAASLKVGGQPMLDSLSAVVQAGGADSLEALREISKDAPEVASVGWLVSVGGSQEAIKDAAEGIRLRQNKEFKSLAPTQENARRVMVEATKGALAGLPQSEQALIDVANAIYETRAQKKGLTTNKPGSGGFDEELWMQGLNEALGQTAGGDGTTFGGVARQTYDSGSWFSSGKMPVLLPPNVRNDALPDLLAAFATEDFSDNRPRAGDGSTVEISRIRNATLKTIAAGRYLVSLGDPLGNDPQWLMDAKTGQKYVLDLNAFEPVLRARRPDLYRP